MRPTPLIIIVIIGVMFFPQMVFGSVYISEVAWMGSKGDANAEWIELYNDGESTDVTGWMLTALDDQPHILLSGTLAPHSYALLERSDDDTVPGVSAFLVYTGSLGNDGETLELKDVHNVVIDRVDGKEAWSIGGNNDTKETLQRSGEPATGTWITEAPTPHGGGGTTFSGDDVLEGEVGTSSHSVSKGGVLGAAVNRSEQKSYLKPGLTLDAEDEMTVVVGVPTTFSLHAYNEHGNELLKYSLCWNFGDGVTECGKIVNHAFRYSGDYIVTVSGKRLGFLSEISAEERVIIHVIKPLVTIVEANKEYVEVYNESDYVMDISDYILFSEGVYFRFPEGTVILPERGVRFSSSVTGLHGSTASLTDPNGILIANTKGVLDTDTSQQLVMGVSTVRAQEPDALDNEVHAHVKSDEVSATLFHSPEVYAQEEEVTLSKDERTTWWWLLGFITAVFAAVLLIVLVRREQEEVVEGYLIKHDS